MTENDCAHCIAMMKPDEICGLRRQQKLPALLARVPWAETKMELEMNPYILKLGINDIHKLKNVIHV